MNYTEFLEYKNNLLKDNPQIINLAENNLYQYFSVESYPIPTETVYRCHLVEDYLKYLSLPDSSKFYVGASSGIRASLSILFKELPNWTIPQDVYPFYQQELNKYTNNYQEYPTLTPRSLFEDLSDGTVLITYPLKPQARDYNSEDFVRLMSFLKRNSQNLIVIDMVYWLNQYIPTEILELYQTNQVILMHSLSKCFLLPNHFGITLLPQNEQGKQLRESFKSLTKDSVKLQQVYQALRNPLKIPQELKNKILENTRLVENILKNSLPQSLITPRYLFYQEKTPKEFLKENILVIPESVFGGTGSGSIISILI